jgi:lactate dehydrogenase-like 2-hydroxyacid dehydrogenase
MRVLISGRKEAKGIKHIPHNESRSLPSIAAQDEGRTSFDDLLSKSTVIFVAVPRSPDTIDLISTRELELMSSHAVLVDISRGGIVNEAALSTALKDRRIAGAATDVFTNEPAGPENSPLLEAVANNSVNLVVSPHLAWLSKTTTENYLRMGRENVKGFCTGKPCNIVV